MSENATGRLSEERIYEVFARKDRGDRFEHVGAVTAPNADLARVYAWQTYDEAKWYEMAVARRDRFHAVNLEQSPFTLGGPPPIGEGSAADSDSPPGYGTPS